MLILKHTSSHIEHKSKKFHLPKIKREGGQMSLGQKPKYTFSFLSLHKWSASVIFCFTEKEK